MGSRRVFFLVTQLLPHPNPLPKEGGVYLQNLGTRLTLQLYFNTAGVIQGTSSRPFTLVVPNSRIAWMSSVSIKEDPHEEPKVSATKQA